MYPRVAQDLGRAEVPAVAGGSSHAESSLVPAVRSARPGDRASLGLHSLGDWQLHAGILLSEEPDSLEELNSLVARYSEHFDVYPSGQYPAPELLKKFHVLLDRQTDLAAWSEKAASLQADLHPGQLTPDELDRLIEDVKQHVAKNPHDRQAESLNHYAAVLQMQKSALLPAPESLGIYHERQEPGTLFCGMHALNSVLHCFDKPVMSAGFFKDELYTIRSRRVQHEVEHCEVLDESEASTVDDIVALAHALGLKPQKLFPSSREFVPHMALADARAIMILRAGHWIALMRGNDDNWYEMNSLNEAVDNNSYGDDAAQAYVRLAKRLRDADLHPTNLVVF